MKANCISISNVIKNLTSKWKITPHEINNGLCEEFALAVIDILGGDTDDLYELCTENFNQDLIGHVWIFYKGRHFDSETPNGVNNWFELPVFTRAR